MGNEATLHERTNGIYYTPTELAEYLAEPLVTRSRLSILDPAYGEGSLLLAAEKIYLKNVSKSTPNLYGCDIKPVNGLLKHLPQANLKKINFFKYPTHNKFSLVLMNPPFVRHHYIETADLEKMKLTFPELNILSNSSDLWAYFVLKSIYHLKPGGNIGAILPWSFLQADYSIPLRKKLSEMFGEIKVLSLSEKFFSKAEERIVLVWLYNFGTNCRLIRVGSSKHIPGPVIFRRVSKKNWISNKVLTVGENKINRLFTQFKSEYGFEEFENYAEAKIGIVTGADKFFITSIAKAKQVGFKKSQLVPIITTSKEFCDVQINGTKNLKYLIKIKKKDYTEFRGFLQKGRNKGFHLRAHSALRKPWYSVRIGEFPDSFFPYRTSMTPYLLSNEYNIQSTNSIHRIYFKNLTAVQIKWIHVSILSTISQLSIEANSKTYGRGILKIEPGSLKKALILTKSDPDVIPIYNKISTQLKKNNKAAAVEIATDFIASKLDIPKTLMLKVKSELTKIQSCRHS